MERFLNPESSFFGYTELCDFKGIVSKNSKKGKEKKPKKRFHKYRHRL